MTLSDKTSGTIKSKSLVELLNHKVELKKQLIELKRDTNKSEELVKELSDAISDIEIFLSKHRIQK
jgi:SPX domain protein involved in polyphosphate accumulation|tara:strand:+ start:745 stop:942 length:198 start_codon:yes stop_codon:yes gene_type:complete